MFGLLTTAFLAVSNPPQCLDIVEQVHADLTHHGYKLDGGNVPVPGVAVRYYSSPDGRTVIDMYVPQGYTGFPPNMTPEKQGTCLLSNGDDYEHWQYKTVIKPTGEPT